VEIIGSCRCSLYFVSHAFTTKILPLLAAQFLRLPCRSHFFGSNDEEWRVCEDICVQFNAAGDSSTCSTRKKRMYDRVAFTSKPQASPVSKPADRKKRQKSIAFGHLNGQSIKYCRGRQSGATRNPGAHDHRSLVASDHLVAFADPFKISIVVRWRGSSFPRRSLAVDDSNLVEIDVSFDTSGGVAAESNHSGFILFLLRDDKKAYPCRTVLLQLQAAAAALALGLTAKVDTLVESIPVRHQRRWRRLRPSLPC
jgi:hypothetical protein